MNLLRRQEDRMEYAQAKELSATAFRRLTGVKPEVFRSMAEVLQDAEDQRRLLGGHKRRRLSVEDQLLMMLEYWREYRTYFHIGQSRNLSESQAYKIIKRSEDALVKSGRFTLPGKKALLKSDMQYEVVLIDATETPVERPKKSSGNGTRARKSATR
jgi:hypothetical protein